MKNIRSKLPQIDPPKKPLGRRIIESLEEVAQAIESGEPLARRFTVRTVEVSKPGKYSPAAVKRLREKLGVSQALFAEIVGVSKKLVEHWESGIRKPSTMACRLFDAIARDPAAFIRRTQKPAA